MQEPADWMRTAAKRRGPKVDLRIDQPHPARIYDVLLGGKTNYPADRAAARQVEENLPSVVRAAHVNREFMGRAVRYLAGSGISQFLDIGTGIPTSPNLHEIAQRITPRSRVVYADNDPIVLAHSRALHTGSDAGQTAYVQADVTTPAEILRHPDLTDTLDLDQPVALTMLLLLHWLPQEADPHAIVAELLDALPSGSYLALTHATGDFDTDGWGRISAGLPVWPRTREQVALFFEGLDVVEPGLVVPQLWRPDEPAGDVVMPAQWQLAPAAAMPTDVPIWAGVARKP
jgi:hypothetical protein